eukprot:5528763-Prymnesium_polylepis.1
MQRLSSRARCSLSRCASMRCKATFLVGCALVHWCLVLGHTPVLFSRDALLAHVLACVWAAVLKNPVPRVTPPTRCDR